jgi:ribosomal protein S18 acetylase RimI-like enzyme
MGDESGSRGVGESGSDGARSREVEAARTDGLRGVAGGVTIGALAPERWREYRGLRLEALRSDPDAFGSTYVETERFSDDFWRRRLADPDILFRFAERDGRLIGMAGALCDRNPATIASVYVARNERRTGVGRRLLTALLEAIAARPGFDAVRLWVSETEPAAIALYRSLGFQPIDREIAAVVTVNGVYDELIMEKRLD